MKNIKHFFQIIAGGGKSGMVIGLAGLFLATADMAGDALTLSLGKAPEVVRLQQTVADDQVLRLEASDNLKDWREIGRGQGGLTAYPDWLGAGAAHRFYRSWWQPATAGDDGKNQVRWDNEAFLSEPFYSQTPEPRWIKFAIATSQTNKVWFQDSVKYLFHYDFATRRLPEFVGMTRTDFDAVSLHGTGQKIVLGALLYPPCSLIREIGVQFVGLDPYTKEQVAAWLDLMRSVLPLPSDVAMVYMPVYEQSQSAMGAREYFKSRGYTLGSISRWQATDQVYANGWALGRLVFVPAAEINQAYTDGRLLATDILVTDAIPADIPPVAGIIALTPATPNSHVAILSRSFGIPFVFLADAQAAQRLLASTNQWIALRAQDNYGWSASVTANPVIDVPADLQKEILALKTPVKVVISPKTAVGKFSLPTINLFPTDIGTVGGKAAHYGLLMRSIPDHCAPAVVLTFDLWDAYLAQTIGGSNTLGQIIQDRLKSYTYPPDMSRLRADLEFIRGLFRNAGDFTMEQKQAVREALAGFDPKRKIRFRSSTNVEDSENFAGAGLYDSFSGCLADNLDDDEDGPCACDPFEPKEQGVFRAIKKVYASFYNDNAFLERLRHGIDETQAGMAMLVHVSTPDDQELANGVATVAISEAESRMLRNYNMTLVTQAGAESVANPEGNALPEQVTVSGYGDGAPYLSVSQHSGLVPLGATVMDWQTDYPELVQLLDKACQAYEGFYRDKKKFWLDLEYKKVAPGKIVLKQIRPVPQPDSTRQIPAYLLPSTNAYAVYQGEGSDVFAIHRLKSRWSMLVQSMRLDTTNQCVLQGLTADYIEGTSQLRFEGAATQLPGFASLVQTNADATMDRMVRWTWGQGASARNMQLTVNLPAHVAVDQSPLLFLEDASVKLQATYQTGQPVINWSGAGTTLNDEVVLKPMIPTNASSLFQQRKYTGTNLSVTCKFYWPPPPTGPTAGYTAPAQAWVQTVIEGLASQPIRLTADAAQSYHAGHHNFSEEFIFDPTLDPKVPASVRAELASLNIRALYVLANLSNSTQFFAWGFDNQLRELDSGTAGGKQTEGMK